MQLRPVDDRFTDGQECFVDVVAFVETHLESSELVEQRDALFDHVAEYTKTASMFRSPSGNLVAMQSGSTGGAKNGREIERELREQPRATRIARLHLPL
jgi:hypothetical protein